ncbi:hypothetical protein B296_00010828 [Ensete ventricosum]|uniref:Uncharacterized protein n=1 Tax=Ensete ventricosum TaxID=4639 RepID=A0A427AC53_ENSVE|nr:hypothetical protein B296_00010828 [Ensete ventricosum]
MRWKNTCVALWCGYDDPGPAGFGSSLYGTCEIGGLRVVDKRVGKVTVCSLLGPTDCEASRSLTDASSKPATPRRRPLSLCDGGSNAAKVRAEAVRRKWRRRAYVFMDAALSAFHDRSSAQSARSDPFFVHGSVSRRILEAPSASSLCRPSMISASLLLLPASKAALLAGRVRSSRRRHARHHDAHPAGAAFDLRKRHCAFVNVMKCTFNYENATEPMHLQLVCDPENDPMGSCNDESAYRWRTRWRH